VVPIALLLIIPFIPNKMSKVQVGVRVICILSWIIFIAARVFIVIESFISLRSLPPDAFQSVKWTDVIPHI
jgi:hypothetical protein